MNLRALCTLAAPLRRALRRVHVADGGRLLRRRGRQRREGDDGSGWSQNKAENATTIVAQYENDAFLLRTNIASERATSTLGLATRESSLHLEVHATLQSPASKGVYYGLACGGPPNESGYFTSFYSMLIDARGRPTIQPPAQEGGVGYEGLKAIGKPLPDFDPREAHRLTLDCSSDGDATTLALGVDGQPAGELEVDEETGPYEAANLVLVTTGGPSGAEVRYDDFRATSGSS